MRPTGLLITSRAVQQRTLQEVPRQGRNLAAAIIAGGAAALATVALLGTFYDYSYGLDALLLGFSQTTLYYTHWATGLVMVIFGHAAITGRTPPRAIGHALITFSILVLHYWFFRGFSDFVTSPWRSKIVHGLIPALICTYWIAFVDKRRLDWLDPIRWTAFALTYTVYALARGALTGEYAYDVGDVSKLGYLKVLALIGGTILFSLVFGYLLVSVTKVQSPVGCDAIPTPATCVESQSKQECPSRSGHASPVVGLADGS